MPMPHFISEKKISEICLDPSFSSYLQIVKRSDQAKARQAVEPQHSRPESLVFVSTPEQLDQALAGNCSILIALDKLMPIKKELSSSLAVFTTPSISSAMALVLPLFDEKGSRFPEGIHPTAVIDPSAQIGKGVRIGAYAVIGAGVKIGNETVIAPHVVVENGAVIGSRSLMHSFVFIGAHCQIGSGTEIHPHTTVGADGFGFVQAPDKRRHKIPQLGIVVIGDFVEIGANCTIDRATLGETRIGEGSKLDNLCHIGHNSKIGKHNVFAGGFLMSGSCEIGDDCTFGGNVVLKDHVKIGHQVIIGGRSAVTKDIPSPGAYNGYPLESFKDSLRTLSNIPRITKMRKQISQIQKTLGLKDEAT